MIQLLTKETAPKQSQLILDKVEKAYGFIPNIYFAMAESPLALETYVTLSDLISEKSAFSAQEQQFLMIALSAGNNCEYCVAAHSTVASMVKAPDETIEAIRQGRDPADPKLATLVRFARTLQEKRGWVSENERKAFLDAGFDQRHILDILSVLALKTVSNYTNHLVGTPLDKQFSDHRWTRRVVSISETDGSA